MRRVLCNVLFLVDPAIYNKYTDYRYLIDDNNVLLPIDDAREYTHYRITLVGSKTPIPVQGIANAFITDEPGLGGLKLSEVLKQ